MVTKISGFWLKLGPRHSFPLIACITHWKTQIRSSLRKHKAPPSRFGQARKNVGYNQRLFFDNYFSKITLPELSINYWESPNLGLSIKSQTLRILTIVTILRIVYCKSSAENYYQESSTKNHQLKVIILRIIYWESYVKIYHIKSYLF